MPGTRARSSTLADCTPCSPPKCASMRLAALGADAADVLQPRRGARLGAARAVALDREAVRLVADLLQQVQPRMVARRFSTSARSGNTMSSSPGLRSGPLAMPTSGSCAAPAPPAPRRRRRPAPCRRRSPADRAPGIRPRRCARCGASAPRASPRSRRPRCAGLTLKRRYSPVCIASLSKITHEATAASPIVCHMSKHSMRCAVAPGRALPAAPPAAPPASPSARASAGSRARRSAWPSSATRGARRPGCVTSSTLRPACSVSTSASASAPRPPARRSSAAPAARRSAAAGML